MSVARPLLTALAATLFITLSILPAHADMKGPASFAPAVKSAKQPKTSHAAIAFDWAILGFQKFLSPVDGPRCGFHPTCSGFGRQAIHRHGAVKGIMMTGDRLIRCNQWKHEDDNYRQLANGKLTDPVEMNSLVFLGGGQ